MAGPERPRGHFQRAARRGAQRNRVRRHERGLRSRRHRRVAVDERRQYVDRARAGSPRCCRARSADPPGRPSPARRAARARRLRVQARLAEPARHRAVCPRHDARRRTHSDRRRARRSGDVPRHPRPALRVAEHQDRRAHAVRLPDADEPDRLLPVQRQDHGRQRRRRHDGRRLRAPLPIASMSRSTTEAFRRRRACR